MNPTRTQVAPPAATATHRPSDGTDSRPAVELVAGSAPVSENELVPLLHKRLRFLVLVFTVYYVAIFLLRALYGEYGLPISMWSSTVENWAGAATLLAFFGLLAL